MHLSSVINKLSFVIETFLGELGNFFGVSCVKDDGIRGLMKSVSHSD